MSRTHGRSSTYNAGCRCEYCRAAHTARIQGQIARRNARPVPASVEHNASTYSNYGCRCDVCTEANKQDCRRRREARAPAA